MNYFTFSLEKPFIYYKGGEFRSNEYWQHSPMLHQGDFEIIVCIKGPIFLRIDNDDFTLQKDDVLIIPPYKKFQGTKKTEDVDFYWLHFYPTSKVTTQPHSNYIDTDEVKEFIDSDNSIFLPQFLRMKENDAIISLVHQILSLHTPTTFPDQRSFLISALAIEIFNTFLTQNSPQKNDRINYIKEWIRANISSELTVSDVALEMNLSIDYLTKLFKKCTGMTTLQYIHQLKIQVASLLLVRSDLPIKQVASLSYFNDEKVFMKSFKSATGLTPTKYRNRFKPVHMNNPMIDPQIPVPKNILDELEFIPENGNLN